MICPNLTPYRLDCGCLKYPCSGTDETGGEPDTLPCSISLFIKNQILDTNCDQLDTDWKIVLSESIGACSLSLNGEDIPNLMCLLESDDDCNFPTTGHFKFKDDYGIIYVSDWEYAGGRLDVTWTTFDPVLPGQEPQGFMVGMQVYRKGIITTTRQILEKDSNDITTIVSEGSQQTIDFFRTTYDCGDERPDDKFRYHLDCAITDELEIEEVVPTGTV